MKNHTSYYGLIFTTILFFHSSTPAQWVKIKSPNYVRSICVSGKNLYAGTNLAGNYAGGIFRSTVNDTTWDAVNTGLPTGFAVTALGACGSNVFTATLLNGVSTLLNSGSTWTVVNNGLPQPDYTGYVWETINAFAISGAMVFAVENNGKLFRSADSGKTWTTVITTGLINPTVYSITAKGDTVYAGVGKADIRRSIDKGVNWGAANVVKTGLPNLAVTAFAISGSAIFCGTDAGLNGGVYLSTNNCDTWAAETSGLPSNAYVTDLTLDSSNIFVYVGGSGLWRRPLSDMIVPNQIILVSPNDTAKISTDSVNLVWNKGAVSNSRYWLEVSTDSLAATIIFKDTSIVDTFKVVKPLANGQSYWWRVKANNTAGWGAWSQKRSFSIAIPPQPPTLALPANNATAQPLSLIVTWNTTANASTYALQVSSDSNFSSFVYNQSNLTATWQNINGLTNNSTYYWHVNASNVGGTSPWSTTWHLTTIITLPGPITLVAPGDSEKVATDSTILIWRKGGASVAKYLLNVATDSGMVNTIKNDSTITDTTKLLKSLTSGQTYWWRVKANNAAGWGTWSIIRNFSVNIPTSTSLSENMDYTVVSFTKYNSILHYNLHKTSFVSVQIFDIRGRLISRLLNKIQATGYYSLPFPLFKRNGTFVLVFNASDIKMQWKFTIAR
jgi:hypothetical protein